MNMFLAIINDTYSEVKGDETEDEFDMGGFFKRGVDKMLTKAGLAKAKIVDIQNILDSEHNDDDTLDFDEWRAELRVNIAQQFLYFIFIIITSII